MLKRFSFGEYISAIKNLDDFHSSKNNSNLVDILGWHHDMFIQHIEGIVNYSLFCNSLENFLINETEGNYIKFMDHPYLDYTRDIDGVKRPIVVFKLIEDIGSCLIHPFYEPNSEGRGLVINLDSSVKNPVDWISVTKKSFLDVESYLIKNNYSHFIEISNGTNNQIIRFG